MSSILKDIRLAHTCRADKKEIALVNLGMLRYRCVFLDVKALARVWVVLGVCSFLYAAGKLVCDSGLASRFLSVGA